MKSNIFSVILFSFLHEVFLTKFRLIWRRQKLDTEATFVAEIDFPATSRELEENIKVHLEKLVAIQFSRSQKNFFYSESFIWEKLKLLYLTNSKTLNQQICVEIYLKYMPILLYSRVKVDFNNPNQKSSEHLKKSNQLIILTLPGEPSIALPDKKPRCDDHNALLIFLFIILLY